MPEIYLKNAKRAVQNVIDYGDTDVFPYPFENPLIRRDSDKFSELIFDISNNFETYFRSMPPQFESTLVPVGYQGYRWATQIDPFWNTYILATLMRHAGDLERSRVNINLYRAHSYRISADESSSNIFVDNYNWRSFMLSSYEAAKQAKYVVVTDISEFYRRIYHHKIENALEQIIPSSIPDNIIKLLTVFSGGSSYGLPIGGPAARIISEVVINQIDQLLYAKGFVFCRFSDDFHIFTNTEEEAHKAIQVLSELLILNQGLTLQKAKTRILSGSEFIATFPKHLVPDHVPTSDRERLFSLSLNYDPYSPTANEDYEQLKESLNSIDFLSLLDQELTKSQLHGPTASKLIKALKVTSGKVRESAIITMMNNIGLLYPVFTQLLIVLISIKGDLTEKEYSTVCSKILELSYSSSYIMGLDIHKCFSVRLLQGFNDYRVRVLFDRWYHNGTPLLRRDIIVAYIAGREVSQLSDIKNRLSNATPWERRAFIAGSYLLKDEGKHWRNAQTFNPFETFVRDAASDLHSKGEIGIIL